LTKRGLGGLGFSESSTKKILSLKNYKNAFGIEIAKVIFSKWALAWEDPGLS
jgi:hypothetical protein